jgi:Zn-dependent protease with chaperone function
LFNISKETMEFVGPTVLILLGIIFSFIFVVFMKKLSKKQEERANQFEQEVLASNWVKEAKKKPHNT